MTEIDLDNLRLGGYTYNTDTRNDYKKICKKMIKGNVQKTSNISEQPRDFKLKLWDHQLSILNAMEEYEKNSMRFTEEVDVGVVSNKVGSGKSAIILALINNTPVYKNKKKLICKGDPADILNTNNISNSMVYRQKYLIKSNLIVIPHGIYNQWLDYIKDYSNLTVYGIDRRRKILENYKDYSDYDIILCKSTMYNDLVSSYSSDNKDNKKRKNRHVETLYEDSNVSELMRGLEPVHHKSVLLPNTNYGVTYFLQRFKTYKKAIENYKKSLDTMNAKVSSVNIDGLVDGLKCGDGYHIENYTEVRGIVWSRIIFDEADSINISKCYQTDAHMIWCITSNLLNLLLNQGATDNFCRIIVNRLGASGFVNYMMTEKFLFF